MKLYKTIKATLSHNNNFVASEKNIFDLTKLQDLLPESVENLAADIKKHAAYMNSCSYIDSDTGTKVYVIVFFKCTRAVYSSKTWERRYDIFDIAQIQIIKYPLNIYGVVPYNAIPCEAINKDYPVDELEDMEV